MLPDAGPSGSPVLTGMALNCRFLGQVVSLVGLFSLIKDLVTLAPIILQ